MQIYTAKFASYDEYKAIVNNPLSALEIIHNARESGFEQIRFQIPAHNDGEKITSEPWNLNNARAVLVERYLPRFDQLCSSDDQD